MRDATMDNWLRDIGIPIPGGDSGDDATAPSDSSSATSLADQTSSSDASDNAVLAANGSDPTAAAAATTVDPSTVTDPSNPPPPASTPDDSTLPRPCLPDCKPLRNHVAGPKNIVLCATHGHVYDEDKKQIIYNSVAEYDAANPVPRPMQSDCAPDPGKLPYAPKNIVVCKTHGHVLDTDKKQIVGNTRTMYLRAHPEHGGANSGADVVGHVSLNESPAKSNVDEVTLTLDLHATGDWQFQLSWVYAKEPEGETPEQVQEVVLINAPDNSDADAVYCFPHAVEAGKTYTYAGKGRIKSVPEGTWNVEVQIMPKGWPDKMMDREFQDFEVKKKP